MRVMAIDYGDARTGVALSDPSGLLTGFTTVASTAGTGRRCWRSWRHCARSGVRTGLRVMGFPRNMDGTEGPRAALYREFAASLEEATGMPVRLWDERRTTVEAHQILSSQNYHGKKRKNTVDAVAASLILEGYLGYLRNHPEEV